MREQLDEGLPEISDCTLFALSSTSILVIKGGQCPSMAACERVSAGGLPPQGSMPLHWGEGGYLLSSTCRSGRKTAVISNYYFLVLSSLVGISTLILDT
jgi:hypothetical protein